MKYYILTIFPEMVEQVLSTSILGKAADKGIISFEAVNIRDYTLDKHKKTDDYPYGGGAGMVMSAQPIYDAHRAIVNKAGHPIRTIYLTPQGRVFNQPMAKEYAREEDLIFLCGHYEGIDERVLEEIVTDYVSIGDYVLTGGELPAVVMIDAISRMVPGVLTNEESGINESLEGNLLEHPQYTRPAEWNGKKVPDILLSGDHAKVDQWRHEQSLIRTAKARPELLNKAELSDKDVIFLKQNQLYPEK
ncbi:MAG: tRNA (guanosine(37)-N1)-methyltransferase TrmD [Eubacterium sp.]|nr:tRNA (guanosine(37)-N1)-methyltransferase TrmD [Eubacterium sp.]